MRRAQDRARSARSRKNGARSATIESRALGALKLASEASCALSARWECARKAGRFFLFQMRNGDSTCPVLNYDSLIIIFSQHLFSNNLHNYWSFFPGNQIFTASSGTISLQMILPLTYPIVNRFLVDIHVAHWWHTNTLCFSGWYKNLQITFSK